MILANGKLYDSRQQESILSGLERRVLQTLAGPPLSSEAVIAAIDRLGRRLDRGAFAPLLWAYCCILQRATWTVCPPTAWWKAY